MQGLLGVVGSKGAEGTEDSVLGDFRFVASLSGLCHKSVSKVSCAFSSSV